MCNCTSYFLTGCLLLVNVLDLYSQINGEGKMNGTYGTRFLVGFMQNDLTADQCDPISEDDRGNAWVMISSPGHATIKVTGPDNNVQIFPVNTGETVTMHWPIEQVECAGDGPCNKSIEIVSDNPVGVYCLSSKVASSDGYLALPVEKWGREYVSVNNQTSQLHHFLAEPAVCEPAIRRGEFLVIAATDNTVVRVVPGARTLAGAKKGEIMTRTLMSGEMWQVQSAGNSWGQADLTGSFITADKPIGVLSGHMRTDYMVGSSLEDGFTKNHLVEMLQPVGQAGRNHVVVPFVEREGGDLVRVVALGDDSVEVLMESENEQKTFFLHGAGTYITAMINETTRIVSSRPVTVVQIGRSGFPDKAHDFDPTMVLVPPQEQYVYSCMFRTLDDRRYWHVGNDSGQSAMQQYTGHYLSIVTGRDHLRDMRINGKPLLGNLEIVALGAVPGDDRDQVWLACRLPEDVLIQLESSHLFMACMYGAGPYDAYGWPAGGGYRGVYAPAVSIRPDCPYGVFEVEITEVGSGNVGIASVAVETLSGVPIAFDTDDGPLDPGASAYRLFLSSDDALDSLRIITSDVAGNTDTVQVYLANVLPEFATGDSVNWGPISRWEASSRQIEVYNPADQLPMRLDSVWFSPGTFVPYTEDLVVIGEDGNPVRDTLIGPGEVLVLTVKLDPRSDREASSVVLAGKLHVGVDCREYTLPMTGTLRAPGIRLLRADIGVFPDTQVGDTVCQEVAVQSTGEEPLVIDDLSLDLSDGFFLQEELLPSFPIVLLPGSHFTFVVCYVPDQVERNIDAVIVSSNAIGKGIFQIPLFGSGVNDILSIRDHVRSETEFGGAFFENGTVVVADGETDLKNYTFALYSALGRQIPVKSQRDRSPERIRLTPSEILPSGAYYLNGVNTDGEILMKKFVVIR